MAMRNMRIKGGRLFASLMEMAEIGATPKGGCCRLALTDLDKQARDLFVGWCADAGCTVRIDAVGNIFARRPGRDNGLPPVMAGSHLDTQPTGGKFDGVLGVLAGLEVVRTLNDHGVETEAPVEVCVWTNEEGTRFAPSMMGSGVFSGDLDLSAVKAMEDAKGITVGEELHRLGAAGDAVDGPRHVGAYFELHIEQGPVLEAEDTVIGVVTAANGQAWCDITVTGQEAHAGPTPMGRRRDALVAASRIVQEINRIGRAHPPHGAATVGAMEVRPNSRNVIPGEVFFTVDLRHPDAKDLAAMKAALASTCRDLARDTGMEIAIAQVMDLEPTHFNQGCINSIREGAELCGLSHMDIVSGAGHDAINISHIAPAGMIFVPCKDGISHNEIEDASLEHCAAGCDVLLQAVLAHAGTGD